MTLAIGSSHYLINLFLRPIYQKIWPMINSPKRLEQNTLFAPEKKGILLVESLQL